MTQGFFIPFSDLVKLWWDKLSEEEKDTKLGVKKPPKVLPKNETFSSLQEMPISADYDLQLAFQKLNLKFFDGGLETPNLRWGKKYTKIRRSITYGYYEKKENRITMNPMLRESHVPYEVFDYVFYHEMLHMICEGFYEKRGRKKVFIIHTPEFKNFEKLHPSYKYARRWLRENLKAMIQIGYLEAMKKIEIPSGVRS